jgi:cytoplasmic iron level regulating protein YaaA (DUF328/UPF0246 family)
MKIVISPAKSLNFETELPTSKYTEPFLKESRQIKSTKATISKDLSELMDISAKLADLNWQRNTKRLLLLKMRPAIYAFDGDVYGRGCLFDSYRKIRKVTR